MTILLAQQVGGNAVFLLIIFAAVGYILGLSVIVGAIIVRSPQRVVTPCQVIAVLCCPIAIQVLALHVREYDFDSLLPFYATLRPSELLLFLSPAGMAIVAGVIRFLRRRAAAGGGTSDTLA